MEKIIITAGEDFTDIDILACAVSYNELLRLEGKDSDVILIGEFNKSITDEIKGWDFKYKKEPIIKNCIYVIVDISHPEHLAKFVDVNKIVELYDHHFGYEKNWQDKINGRVVIEQVGSCATLIWEEFVARIKPLQISHTSANLLTAAIISNTLNFKASVTNKRDIDAFNELNKYANLPTNFTEKYFEDQEVALFKDPVKEIVNDTHIEVFPNTKDKLIIGQIELWDGKKFIRNCQTEIENALSSFGSKDWFLTSPSISEGKNYIYTKSSKVKKLLEKELNLIFKGDVGETEKLYLRKEIKKIIYNY